MQRRQRARMSASLHDRPLARAARRRVSALQLALLGRERLDHAHAVDVLVDDGGDVGRARDWIEPRHREHLAAACATPTM